MKPVGIVSPVALCLLFTAPAFAQPRGEPQQGRGQQGQHAQPQQQQQRPHQENAAPNGPRQQDRGREGQESHKMGPPQERQEPHQSGRPQERQRQEQQRQVGERHEPQREQRMPPARRPPPQERRGQGERRAAFQEHRAHNWKAEHRNWQERGGYRGYRIPESRYRGHFGPAHAFRLQSRVAVVGGYPRFQYGGFRFDVVDPWPEYWSDDWYDNDDVYVDYSGDGYYLYNRRYPGDRIAITVNVN